MDLIQEAALAAQWPSAQRVVALKRIVSEAELQQIVAGTRRGKAFCRCLPAWFMVWFVVALGLFCRDSYCQTYRWLQVYRRRKIPLRSTLCEARQALGVAVMRKVYEATAKLLVTARTPGGMYQGLRLMAVDGFVIDLADTKANERAFGRPGGGRSPGAFPQARVLALCETGSHVLWRSLIKPICRGEISMVPQLLRLLRPDMLLLWDRGFFSYGTVDHVRRQGAQLLARVKNGLVFRPIRHLPDGSYLAKVYPSPQHRERDEQGLVVRIIEYTFDDPGRPGSGQKHRLLTTLIDAELHPATELIALYHERWEEELTIDELKTHQRERPVLRSQTPGGVVQEIYGLLIGHFVVRSLMHEAAEAAGVAPRRISFTGALKILRCRLAECPGSDAGRLRWFRNLVREVSQEVIEPRRNRINPRVVKRKLSGWPKKHAEHRRYPQPHKNFAAAIVLLN